MKVAAVLLSLVAIAAAFFTGQYVGDHSAAWENAKAAKQLDFGGGRMPLWARLTPCREPTPAEANQNRVALLVLSTFYNQNWSNLKDDAISQLAHTWSQNNVPTKPGQIEPCWPNELAPAITTAALNAQVFSGPFLHENAIALAEHLGPRDQQIVEAVARSAFSESAIPEDAVDTDSRPYARLVLAEFGTAARPWSAKAFAQISSNDQLGTGAAQIAVAAGAPGALQKVQRLMENILKATPEDKPIPRLSRNRFL